MNVSEAIVFKKTQAGNQAALDAQTNGLRLKLNRYRLSSENFLPVDNDPHVALSGILHEGNIAVGQLTSDLTSLRISLSIISYTELNVASIGIYDENDVLYAVASIETGYIFQIFPNITFLASFGIQVNEIDVDVLTIIVDNSAMAAQQLMIDHETEANPHPQYADLIDWNALKNLHTEFKQALLHVGRWIGTDDPTFDPSVAFYDVFGRDTVWRLRQHIPYGVASLNDVVEDVINIGSGVGSLVTNSTYLWQRMPDGYQEPAFSISASATEIDEGESVTITLIAENIPEGTLIPYTIQGVTLNDIAPSRLEGTFTVNAQGTAEISILAVMDFTTDGVKNMHVALLSFPSVYTMIKINDTSSTVSGVYLEGDYTIPVLPNQSVMIDMVAAGGGGGAAFYYEEYLLAANLGMGLKGGHASVAYDGHRITALGGDGGQGDSVYFSTGNKDSYGYSGAGGLCLNEVVSTEKLTTLYKADGLKNNPWLLDEDRWRDGALGIDSLISAGSGGLGARQWQGDRAVGGGGGGGANCIVVYRNTTEEIVNIELSLGAFGGVYWTDNRSTPAGASLGYDGDKSLAIVNFFPNEIEYLTSGTHSITVEDGHAIIVDAQAGGGSGGRNLVQSSNVDNYGSDGASIDITQGGNTIHVGGGRRGLNGIHYTANNTHIYGLGGAGGLNSIAVDSSFNILSDLEGIAGHDYVPNVFNAIIQKGGASHFNELVVVGRGGDGSMGVSRDSDAMWIAGGGSGGGGGYVKFRYENTTGAPVTLQFVIGNYFRYTDQKHNIQRNDMHGIALVKVEHVVL